MKIKAAVLEKVGSPLRIVELEHEPLKIGQVLVKVFYSGVCRSQLMEVKGGRGEDKWLPHLLGHEGSGVVISVGEGVSKVKPGDKVILSWIKSSGIDAAGAIYHSAEGPVNSGAVTTFSNYAVVSENRLVIKPAAMSPDIAVLFGCALPTGAGMIFNELNILPSDKVGVIGLGGIGISALIALMSLGVKEVFAIDISDEKLFEVKKWGLAHCFNSKAEDIKHNIIALTNGGLDYCIEAGGSIASIELGFALIRKGGGRLLFASHPPEGEKIALSPHDLISGKHIAGSWGGAVKPDRDIPLFFSAFSHSKIPLNSLLTKRYKLEQINKALIDLDKGRVFRPLIEMQH